MKFRFTIKQLQKKDDKEYLSDLKMLRALVAERKSEVSNPYAPLSERLKELYNKLDIKINNGQTEL